MIDVGAALKANLCIMNLSANNLYTFRREKSVEAYKAEIGCMNRLRHEIIHLRALTSSQQDIMAQFMVENESLRREKFLIGNN